MYENTDGALNAETKETSHLNVMEENNKWKHQAKDGEPSKEIINTSVGTPNIISTDDNNVYETLFNKDDGYTNIASVTSNVNVDEQNVAASQSVSVEPKITEEVRNTKFRTPHFIPITVKDKNVKWLIIKRVFIFIITMVIISYVSVGISVAFLRTEIRQLQEELWRCTGVSNDLMVLNKSVDHLQKENQALKQNLQKENQTLEQNVISFNHDIARLKQQDTTCQLEYQNLTKIVNDLQQKEASNRVDVDMLIANISGPIYWYFSDCLEIYKAKVRANGLYYISTDNITQFPVYCDMSNGGWTLIQRRVSDSVNFTRGWNDYVNGFGEISGNFWLGLKHIHQLTSPPVDILLEVVTKDTHETATLKYSNFYIDGPGDNYRMHINPTGTYNSVAQNRGYNGENGFGYHNNGQFETYDHPGIYNCVGTWKGAWWYNHCWVVSLNRPFETYDHPGIYNCVGTWKGAWWYNHCWVVSLNRPFDQMNVDHNFTSGTVERSEIKIKRSR